MLTAIIAITLLALVLGLLLGFASIRFKVEGDPIVDQIDKILPQTQCGQCSFAGCRPYAEAIAAGDAALLVDRDTGACVRGCYRCLLSYFNQPDHELIDRAVPHLTSRDPARFWTSGQWMTETTGGSDVGRSETRAVSDDEGGWRLYGRKWFTSGALNAAYTTALSRMVPELLDFTKNLVDIARVFTQNARLEHQRISRASPIADFAITAKALIGI